MNEPIGAGTPAEPDAAGSDGVVDCVSCHRPIQGHIRTVGGRPYCAEHYARATLGSRGTWPALVAMLVGLVALGLVMFALGSRIWDRSEEHTSELQSQSNLVCR